MVDLTSRLRARFTRSKSSSKPRPGSTHSTVGSSDGHSAWSEPAATPPVPSVPPIHAPEQNGDVPTTSNSQQSQDHADAKDASVAVQSYPSADAVDRQDFAAPSPGEASMSSTDDRPGATGGEAAAAAKPNASGRGRRLHLQASDLGNDRRPSNSSGSKLSSIDETEPVETHHPRPIPSPVTSGPDAADGTARPPSIEISDSEETSAPNPIPAETTAFPHRTGPLSPDLGSPTPTQRLYVSSTVGSVPTSPAATRPEASDRRQSSTQSRQSTLARALAGGTSGYTSRDTVVSPAGNSLSMPTMNGRVTSRKIWVKRPGASATLVSIGEDDVVDDVRDMILRKYRNSLGALFDSPDLTLRIVPREQRQERTLGPEEPMLRTLEAYFPGGQTVDEALVIDVPLRRTPRPSPRTGPPHAEHMTSVYYDELRPAEGGTDYFGPGALSVSHLPIPGTTIMTQSNASQPHAIAVLNTGQIPQIPSPGGTRSRNYRDRPDRPRLGRQHTSSPTILNMAAVGGHSAAAAAAGNAGAVLHGTQVPLTRNNRSRTHSSASSDHSAANAPAPPPLPSPPAPEATTIQRVSTPPPRVSSPRPTRDRPKKKKTVEHPVLPAGLLNGGVPPINVLIVEDNIINLKLLEAFVKRLKVRWQTAMNGRDAVTKWRSGGFHLVLMDIQLPVMSGLEATREIRRLERVNSIGVFSSASSAPEITDMTGKEVAEEDKLANTDMFKSPVIIVALTASSLQSDRHEALAAGCNDFLTKVSDRRLLPSLPLSFMRVVS
jgi:osomolarity two-component system, response regulator SSK1